MAAPIAIRMAGYGPPSTTFSQALQLIADTLTQRFGDRLAIDIVWNVMDHGRSTEDLWTMVDRGEVTLAYLSTSGLSARVPELGIADLPFLFKDEATARAVIDGGFGAYLAARMEAVMNYRVLGFFENGFRHVSNALRPVRVPADLAGMRIRTLNSRIQARTFELLGAVPMPMGLNQLIEALPHGGIDAQENPLANTVTYGAHKFHRFHTLTNHFYISRAVFAHRPSVAAWPEEVRLAVQDAVAQAIVRQRTLAQEEEISARQAIEDQGGEVIELDDEQRAAFQAAVRPIYREAHHQFGDDIFRVVDRDSLALAY